MRLKYQRTSKTPVLTARNLTWGNMRHHGAAQAARDHLTAARFNFAVDVTHYILTALHFTYTEGIEAWVELVWSGLLNT